MELTPTPLVDLHRHHDTSHTPESLWRVARQLNIEAFRDMTVDQIRQEIQAPPGSSFNEWLTYLDKVRKAYVSVEAVAELTRDVIRDAKAQGLGLLELRISLLSTANAIKKYQSTMAYWDIARQVLEALIAVKHEEEQASSISVDLIMSISCRNAYFNLVDDYVRLLKDYASEIIAVDLTNEQENPPTRYMRAIDQLRGAIPYLTIHCMEVTGPDRGWMALGLKPDRIGHGINVLQDPKLVEAMLADNVIFEVCPLSNILTGVATQHDHPFHTMDASGLKLTINHDGLNDDRTLEDDYRYIQSTFNYTDEQMAGFKRNAWESAFRNLRLKARGNPVPKYATSMKIDDKSSLPAG